MGDRPDDNLWGDDADDELPDAFAPDPEDPPLEVNWRENTGGVRIIGAAPAGGEIRPVEPGAAPWADAPSAEVFIPPVNEDEIYEMQPYHDPPTGQVPKVVIGSGPQTWASNQPRWRDEDDRSATTEDFSDLTGDGERLGALGEHSDVDLFDDEPDLVERPISQRNPVVSADRPARGKPNRSLRRREVAGDAEGAAEIDAEAASAAVAGDSVFSDRADSAVHEVAHDATDATEAAEPAEQSEGDHADATTDDDAPIPVRAGASMRGTAGRSLRSRPADDGDEPRPPRPRPQSLRSQSLRREPRRVPPMHDDVEDDVPSGGGDRNVPVAIAVGVGLLATGLICFKFGIWSTVGLITVVLTACAYEFFVVTTRKGYRPATLLGLAAVAGFSIAPAVSPDFGYPVLIAIAVISTMLWFFWVDPGEGALLNGGVTLFGVLWIGGLGSLASFTLGQGRQIESVLTTGKISNPGLGIIVAATLITVAHDVGAYFVGKHLGSSPLSKASPKKTIEGVIGGVLAAIFVPVIILYVGKVDPVGTNFFKALVFCVMCAVMAPLGDLAQSAVKRDLKTKDMGTILPGHGGVLDRFDAFLFVIPMAWCMAHALNLGPAPGF
jgi:CDP-diglyceride synthetase